MANTRNLQIAGTTDIETVTYNGNEVAKVIYNGVTVWENAPVYGYLTYTTSGSSTSTYEITSLTELQKLAAPSALPTEPYTITLDDLNVSSAQVKKFRFTALGGGAIINNFLAGCTNLTELEDMENLNEAGSYFCAGCTSLNSPVYYPGSHAQSGTTAWTGEYFLMNCTSFNSTVTLAPNITYIGTSFLIGCVAFNQALSLPNTLIGIRDTFLQSCSSFNQPISLPDGITSLGINFLQYCSKFNSALKLPAGLTRTRAGFLAACVSFNQPLDLPSTLREIGSGFMEVTTAFAQPLTLPDGLTSIGYNFMLSPSNFVGPLSVPTGVTYTTDDIGTLAVLGSNRGVPAYATGVSITGAGASEFRAAYPNGYHNPYYRNLH